ncbi:MAG: hypothetical protein H7263_07560 [Candidatus Sericytochromatia bacterium]|nr:hypothetical protein [Candidatus Sericytochromatia bacterium]
MKFKIGFIKLSFIFSLFIFINQPLKASAIETKPIEIESDQSIVIELGGITNYILTENTNLKVETITNGLLLTGIQPGSIPLYVWRGKELTAYMVTTVPKTFSTPLRFFRTKTNTDEPSGFYNVQSFSSFFDTAKSGAKSKLVLTSQMFNHSFVYTSPFVETKFYDFVIPKSNLSFNANFINNFGGLTEIKDIYLQNILLNYQNKYFSIDLGDTTPNLSLSNVYNINTSLRGAKLTFKNIYDTDISFFSGLERSPIYFYNTPLFLDQTIKNPSLVSGGSILYQPKEKNLELSASVLNSSNAIDKTKVGSNISTAINWHPSINFSLNGNVATNLASVFINADPRYRYIWDKKNIIGMDWSELEARYIHYGKNYLRNNSSSQDTYDIGLRLAHQTNTSLSTNYSVNYNDNNLFQRDISVQLSKDKILGIASIYGLANFSNSLYGDITSYETGSSIYSALPINFSYRYTQELLKVPDYLQQFRANINFLRTKNFGVSSTGTINLRDSAFYKDANYNLTLLFNTNFDNNLSISTAFSYIKLLSSSSQPNSIPFNHNEDSLSSTLISSYSHLNQDFSLNLGISNNITNYFSLQALNASLSYTYKFGGGYDDYKGDIQGIVFDDANDNGIFDPGEKILPNIKIKTKNGHNAITTAKGYELKNLDYDAYDVAIDNETLPEGYRITSVSPVNTILETKVKKIDFAVRNEVVISGVIFANKVHTLGLSNIKVILDGQESLITDASGSFYFKTKAGKHTIKLDLSSFPQDYSLADDFVQEVTALKETTNVNFSFNPFISLKGQAFFQKKGYKVFAPNIPLHIKFITDEETKENNVKTDNTGSFLLKNLEQGTIEISSPYLDDPVEYEVPSEPGRLKFSFPVLEKTSQKTKIIKDTEDEKEEK